VRKQQLHLEIQSQRECRELQTDQPHLNPCEDDGVNNPEKVSKHIKNKTITGRSHGLTKRRSYLTKLMGFYNSG